MSIKERARIFCAHKGIKVADFERASNLSNGYLNNVRKSPSLEKVEGIRVAYPDLNVHWLITGQGEMLKTQSTNTVVTGDVSGNGNQIVAGSHNHLAAPKAEEVEEIETLEAIPVITTDQAKAPGVDVKELVLSGSREVKRLSIWEFFEKFGEFDAICPTYRDSMIPTYVPGDFLFIKYKQVTNESYVKQGRYLLDTREHGTILCIVEDTEDGWLTLSFKNSRKYKPMRMKKEDVMSIADIVLMVRMGDMAFDVMDVAQLQQQMAVKDEQYRLLMEQYNKTGDRVNRVIDQNQQLINTLIDVVKEKK